MQLKLYGKDDGHTTQLMLKDTLAIAEATLLTLDAYHLQLIGIEVLNRSYRILYFSTISTNILNWGCTHRAWNSREVLDTPKTIFHTPCHKLVPVVRSLHANTHSLAIIGKNCALRARGRNKHTVVVLRKKCIIACAKHIPFCWLKLLEQLL